MNTKNFITSLTILIIVASSLSYAQKGNSLLLNEHYPKGINSSTESENFRKSLIYVSLIGGSFLLDSTIRKEITEGNDKNLFLRIGHNYGDVYYSFYFAGALYVTQFFWKNNEVAITGKTLLESLAIASLASVSLKFIFGRSRPYVEKGNIHFNWFETKNRRNSFPSGHVITAFTTSTVLSKSLDNTYASIFLYGLAGLTAYQRISSDNHWFSDTVIGASIGILVGEYFSNLNANKEASDYMLIPFYSQNTVGISANFILGK